MGQYHIGILIGNKADDYLHSIRMGVQNTLEEAGETLINIADLIPYHTDANTKNYLRVAVEIAARMDLDAIVVPLGSINNYVGGNIALGTEFLEALGAHRAVVLEREIPGYRCITKKNEPGMHECMRHLIETCGFRHIAFVSGAAQSQGAREREAVFFEEMAAHGLEVPETMFVRGNFSGHCHSVIEQLLANNSNIEAIACASDLIAQTTYQVLRDHKIMVGQDIAVTGFDDQAKAAHMDPPLSTVRMTGYDFGCMAGREALRMCQGLPQEEHRVSSTFIARSSCGETSSSSLRQCRELMRRKPFPIDEFTQLITENTLYMAGPETTKHFYAHAHTFLEKVTASYLAHQDNPSDDDTLFGSLDLVQLFAAEYRNYLSLEGFHAIAITMLEALIAESDPQDVAWVISQQSYLHLRVARLLNDEAEAYTRRMNVREWSTFHLAEDALIDNVRPQRAFGLMLNELRGLGVLHADLFLFPEPIEVVGGKSFALSDSLHYVGSISGEHVNVANSHQNVSLPTLLAHVLPASTEIKACTVAGIMAGNELMGLLTMDPGTLSDNDQLMIALNLGLACKHLQMLENEHEMNELLSENNLVLERQSQRDEMTGLFNRRGLDDRIMRTLLTHPHDLATLLYLDMDGLKHINDTLGHDVGDDAICAAAQVLTECLPNDCLLARMGGDEFVVFRQVNNEDDAYELAQAVQKGVSAYNARSAQPFELSLSCGMACFYGGSGTAAVRDAMSRADELMYENKRTRRKCRDDEQEG